MKRLVVLASLVLLGAVGGASAAPQADLLIRPGLGIGKFRLGMTEAQLRRAAGKPRYVVHRSRTFGLVRVEYQYGFGAEYIATLVGRRGRLRVTRVSTIVRHEKTPKGVGPGSLERTLLRAHPTAHCQPLRMKSVAPGLAFLERPYRTCTLLAASGRPTIFLTQWSEPKLRPGRLHPKLNIENYLRYARVTEVVVARAG